jgi:subtilase family serine protease
MGLRGTARGGLVVGFAFAIALIGSAPASAVSQPRRLSNAPGLRALVNLPCANPANHGSDSPVLGPAPAAAGGALRCFGQAVAYGQGLGPLLMAGPVGYGPAQIQSAYKLTGLSSGGRTVAIVDAYDDPRAEADLATFRQTYGLPPCTTANGCFKKINQTGAASPLPAGDPGWGVEISLDLDAVSSACPDCKLLLAESNSSLTSDLTTAEDAAASVPGVASVSNSWGGNENATILAGDVHFNHPGVAITASSGDSGYGVSWPASSRYVTAVGGTTLVSASNPRGWSEGAWSGAGSGCSAYEPKPSWQHDPGCAKRTVADVSADANPYTGLGIYDTYNRCGSAKICDRLIELGLLRGLDGWAQVGGTSLSSPLVAATYALAGNSATVTYGSQPYSHAGSLFDVSSGSNGSCSPSYLCTAGPGYDGPTGLGTPNGTGAF